MDKHWIEPPQDEPPKVFLDWLLKTYEDEACLDPADNDADRDARSWLPAGAYKGLEIVAQALERRGIRSLEEAESFLCPEKYQPCSAYELPGMRTTVDYLSDAIQHGDTILVWGDFDVDGQTSTSLLVSAIRQLGGKVVYHIPVRENESHGVNIPVLSQLLNDHSQEAIRVLLTCDTGISANEAVIYAKQHELKTLITDHHELPPVLPDALALVNPNFLPEEHPLHSLPGVGVAFKLAEALFAEFGRAEEVEQFFDLAALGCVADVAQLTGETRYLVQRGLILLGERRRMGLRLMMEHASIPQGKISEEQIGFILAPRLNALGRLDDSNPVVEFLIGDDEGRAQVFVARLEALNARRQLLTSQTLQGALAQIEREPGLLEEPILILAHPAWPPGVIGIVASRLVDQFGKPVILLSASPGEAARGSARSVPGFDITEALRWVEAESYQTGTDQKEPTVPREEPRGLFYGFGGHAMAAGMSLPAERIPELRKLLRQAAGLQVIPQPVIRVDAFLDFSELSFELAEQLERLAPFGAGNPALVLASKNLTVQQATRIGRNQEHLRLLFQDAQGQEAEVLWWQAPDHISLLEFIPAVPGPANLEQNTILVNGQLEIPMEHSDTAYKNGDSSKLPKNLDRAGAIDLAYQLATTSYRGQRQLQLTWVDYRIGLDFVDLKVSSQRRIFDYRQERHPLVRLESLLKEDPRLLVWAEGESIQYLRQRLPEVRLISRFSYQTAPGLVIWNPPCSQSDLSLVLEGVQPEGIYLFNVSTGAIQPVSFLERLAGLVKFALRAKQGRVELKQLAIATGQSLLTVRLGLDWLVAKGYIKIDMDEGQHLTLQAGNGLELDAPPVLKPGTPSTPRKPSERLSSQIAALMDETTAFRNYYGRMLLETILS